MTDINRRKFIISIGSFSLGATALNTQRSAALELNVNSFEVNDNIYLEEVHTLLVSIKEMNIRSKNIDDSKEATLDVYGSIEDNNIGKLETRNITLTENSTTTVGPYNFDIKDGSKYKSKYLTLDPYIDKNSIEIEIDFELNHPSINKKITDKANFIIGFSDGEFLSHSEGLNASSLDLTSNGENYRTINAEDLSIWSIEDRFKQLKVLLSGGQPVNKSTYSFPRGVIDIVNKESEISPRNSPEISLSEPNKDKFNISV